MVRKPLGLEGGSVVLEQAGLTRKSVVRVSSGAKSTSNTLRSGKGFRATFSGGLDEADDAALAPGLGDFYEPGMDEAEAP